MFQNIHTYLIRPTGIAPLITFRILFGGLMMVTALRFMQKGWIEKLYVEPDFFFKFYCFEWVKAFDATGMYVLYGFIAVSAALMLVGLFYRWASIVFFLTFTYSELIDATNYLNHYYLVCLLAFILIFLPANRAYSLDVRRLPSLRISHIPQWCIALLMLQIGLVYFYAGFAKLNPDWLFRAMPLASWLPAHSDFPMLGYFFEQRWVAFAFSWAGAFYDLTIPFFLLSRKTRPIAYVAVIVFHVLTKLLFNIGMFPFIMIFSTLIFFPATFHERLLQPLRQFNIGNQRLNLQLEKTYFLWLPFLVFQLIFPLRHYAYPGDVHWTEEGYRFSWRVMLVEKNGIATFRIKDRATGRQSEIINSDYLTTFQEKQMAIQPDFMLQYAQFLAKEYNKKHQFKNPEITVMSYVTLNGRTSRTLIDPNLDLLTLQDDWRPKLWILK